MHRKSVEFNALHLLLILSLRVNVYLVECRNLANICSNSIRESTWLCYWKLFFIEALQVTTNANNFQCLCSRLLIKCMRRGHINLHVRSLTRDEVTLTYMRDLLHETRSHQLTCKISHTRRGLRNAQQSWVKVKVYATFLKDYQFTKLIILYATIT